MIFMTVYFNNSYYFYMITMYCIKSWNSCRIVQAFFNWHSVHAAMYEIIPIIVNNSIIESSTNIYQNYDQVIIPDNNT